MAAVARNRLCLVQSALAPLLEFVDAAHAQCVRARQRSCLLRTLAGLSSSLRLPRPLVPPPVGGPGAVLALDGDAALRALALRAGRQAGGGGHEKGSGSLEGGAGAEEAREKLVTRLRTCGARTFSP